MKKFFALLLALAMVVALVACGAKTETPETTAPQATGESTTETAPVDTTVEGVPATYTYKDSVSTLASNWNPHTYQTTDDAYPADFLRVGL